MDIKTIREALGYTQEQFARQLKVTLATVSRWENGKFSPSRLAREKLDRLERKVKANEKEIG